MSQLSPEAAQALRQLALGKWISQIVYVAAELGLADLMKSGPRTAAEMAAEIKVSADALARIMRALVGLGVFAQVGADRYGLAPMGAWMQSDVPGSLRGFSRMLGHDATWRVWGDIVESVRTGEEAFKRVHGVGAFDYMESHQDFARIFNDAMSAVSGMETGAVIQAYDFRGIETLIDVGGGHGFLLASILKATPGLRGILSDLAHARPGAEDLLAREGVADRCRIVTGDMFASVATGADACIMKHIIHDWSDELSLTILRNCHRALPAGGKLLVVEVVIPPGPEMHFGKLLDIEMLVLTTGGRERTEGDFRQLYEAAGFELTRVVPTQSPVSVVEGRKA
jgi:hypothetical protein